MYVDEVGHPQMKSFPSDNEKYLSLTGVIVEQTVAKEQLSVACELLKTSQFPDHHPDDPVVFHRTDITNSKGRFKMLKEAEKREAFDEELLRIVREVEYMVITACIDKESHDRHYSEPVHPYHYLMEILVERYVNQLESWNAKGDIFVEARNSNDNRDLNREFRLLYEAGTSHVSRDRMQKRLKHGKLTFKRKDQNVAGLQLADLIAHPSHTYLVLRDQGHEMNDGFPKRIVDILLETKYRRDWRGEINGYGTKWLK